MKVLVCEDDTKIRKGLAEILTGEGYQVVEAEDGTATLGLFQQERPDFVLLDIMMPGMSGYDLCRKFRTECEATPIMFISAKSEEIDRVLGLELGADDYLVKPFGVNEVISRIRAITRRCTRSSEAAEPEFPLGPLQIRPRELRAYRGSERIELSLCDVKILTLLHRERGKVVDRDMLFDECWGMNHVPNSRTLDQHISKLRKKLGDDPRHGELIETVHGVGYRTGG